MASSAKSIQLHEVVIVGAARTPMGSLKGSLSSLSGPKLGALAIEEALSRAKCPKENVDAVYMGCAIPAGMGQAPDRQAALLAGLPETVPCTLINKVCASGMKAITLAAQSLMLGENEVMVAGGFESMSNAPFFLKREEPPYGGTRLADGLAKDGLTDGTIGLHMVQCGEDTNAKMGITREEQDDYAKQSYKRAMKAYSEGVIQQEMFDVTIPGSKDGVIRPKKVAEDEELKKSHLAAISSAEPLFKKPELTVTSWNCSKMGDGGSACVLMTRQAAEKHGCTPLAKIVGFADAALKPIEYPIAPKAASDKLLKQLDMKPEQVDLWEINEALSGVVLANMKLDELSPDKVNIHGGAVSLGHPFGSSGCRITNRLVYALEPGQVGVASICNGGGGSSAIMIAKL